MCERRAQPGHTDNAIRLFAFSAATRRFELARTLYGHTGAVTCLEFDGFKLVSGSRDCSIKVGGWDKGGRQGRPWLTRLGSWPGGWQVWNMEDGECLHTFQGHRSAVMAVVFDEQRICSADELGTVRLWSFRDPSAATLAATSTRVDSPIDAPPSKRRRVAASS